MFNFRKQDIRDEKIFESCFDVLLTSIGHFESQKFLHETFFRTQYCSYFGIKKDLLRDILRALV